jgi:AAA+ ATPase superfamily predicted ATPase
MFVDREEELAFLDGLLTRTSPGPAQLVLLYGRRRTGKTALLQHWAERSGLPYIYWVAYKEPAAAQRRSFCARVTDLPEDEAPRFDSWPALWRWFASQVVRPEERRILILDELQYASEGDPAMLSGLQHAWDQHLKHSHLAIALCGSQVGTLESIMARQSPLFGRLTGQWLLQPLPFSALKDFFPNWSPAERVALYAIVGGIPAYLEWLDGKKGLSANIRDVILSPGSMFSAEPSLLLYDELRELSSYHAILRAISIGHHTLKAISDEALISRTNVSSFLSRLRELRLVERRLPVTLTESQKRRSKQGRYHLSDAYFRFFYQFVAPHQRSLLSAEQTLEHIRRHLRGFVGVAFEDLAQQWLVHQARAGALPFMPEAVGAHWSRRVQVDAVAINWQTRDVLLGECKWQKRRVPLNVVRDLIELKGPCTRKDLPEAGEGWKLHYAVFTRAGLTPPAKAELEKLDGLHVDLQALDETLSA